MPSTMTLIGKYQIWINSYGYNERANVRLYTASGTSICLIRFYPPEVTPPPNQINSWLGIPEVNYPLSALSSFIDVLRNEKPLNFSWYGPPDNKGFISTWEGEPVGEEEGT